tara:strand:- start:162 stop:650 length:489 start_codon:yes stop_codon:yes gene_type:complete
MYKLKIENYLKIVFFISLISLVSAYFIEYILGHQPCNLCLIERIPYGLSMLIIIGNFVYNKIQKFLIMLLVLIFISSLIVSFYHLGIEQGIFEESAVCKIKSATDIISKEELLKQLQTKITNCKDVTFRIFGFSLTTVNILINLSLIILLTKIFTNYEKFKN